MSKVYSFRLDENNPREAQARDVIDAWLIQGYSLRYQLVDVLIAFQNNEFQNSQYDKLLDPIESLISNSKEENNFVEVSKGTLTETLIGYLSKSVKSGISIE